MAAIVNSNLFAGQFFMTSRPQVIGLSWSPSSGSKQLDFNGSNFSCPIGYEAKINLNDHLGISVVSTQINTMVCSMCDHGEFNEHQGYIAQTAAGSLTAYQKCNKCPMEANCNMSTATSNPGFALITLSENANTLRYATVMCPRSASCLGGGMNDACAEGYADPEQGCNRCAVGYGRSIGTNTPFECTKCPTSKTFSFAIAILLPLGLVAVGFRSAGNAPFFVSYAYAQLLKIMMSYATVWPALMRMHWSFYDTWPGLREALGGTGQSLGGQGAGGTWGQTRVWGDRGQGAHEGRPESGGL